MKKVCLTLSLIGLVSILGTTGRILASFKNDEIKAAEAYVTSSLPTTINLNATSEAEIRNYYSGVSGINKNNLLSKLKTILSTNQKYYSYDKGDAIWKMYEIVDRDWDLSPANKITAGTYNKSTNTITNYTYGVDNPYLHSLYVDPSASNPMKAYGNHTQDYGGINREHVWPKSHGFDTGVDGGARGDPMHLRAADGYTNRTHSNYYYGYVDTSKSYVNTHDKFSYNGNNLRGTSLTIGNGTVFEPQDSDKGDIARAVFYMAARYNNVDGTDKNIDGNNPNLILNNSITEQTGTSTSTKAFSLGVVKDLLEWNKLDPVDDFEIQRNDILFKNFTNNRNPFIDFPEWADMIWGDSTKTADASKDAIYGEAPADVEFTFNETDVVLKPEEYTDLMVTSSDGKSYNLTWTLTNFEAVSLDSMSVSTGATNKITGLSDGVSFVKVSAMIDDKEVTASCKVTVRSESKTDVESTVIMNTDYEDAYVPTTGGSGEIYKSINKFKDLSITYKGVNTKREGGDPYSYGYGMYLQNEGFIYNTTTPSGYYPSKISVKINGNTSNDARFGVIFSTQPISRRNANVTSSKSISATYDIENTDPKNLYWNFSTSIKNVQVKSITLTYTKVEPELEIDPAALVGSKNTSRTVNAIATHFTDSSLNYTWELDNVDVAQITSYGSSAKITFLNEGEASLTCTAYGENQSVEVSIPITVDNSGEKKLLAIQLNNNGRRLNFVQGDSFVKTSIKAYYSDGTDEIVTQDCAYGTPDMNVFGIQTVNVSYTEGNITKTLSYSINISRAPLTSLRFENETTSFVAGDAFKAPTVYVTYQNKSYSSGEVEVTSQCDYQVDMNRVGEQTVVISFSENNITKNASYAINIIKPDLHDITLKDKVTKFNVGEKFIMPTVMANYKNGTYESSEDVTISSTYTGFDSSKAGKCDITISYKENGITKTATYKVNIVEPSNSKSGCFGSIETTSIVLASISLIGVALILIKKKHIICK